MYLFLSVILLCSSSVIFVFLVVALDSLLIELIAARAVYVYHRVRPAWIGIFYIWLLFLSTNNPNNDDANDEEYALLDLNEDGKL